MSFPKYADYKSSGVEWLGQIPSHWSMAPVSALAELIQSGPFGSQLHAGDYVEDETPVINPTNIDATGVVPDWSCTVGPEIADRLSQHALMAGDIVVGRRGEMGRCAVIPEGSDGWLCGTGCLKVRLRNGMDPEFVAAYLRTPYSRERLKLESVGSTMDNLNAQILGMVPIAVPPLTEQAAITTFLDRETAKIDALVDEQKRLIELLKEKRQAVISQAVTKGLDPSVPMKDSGVEWLGKVPAHWNVVPLMWLTQSDRPIMYGIVLPGPDVGEGVPILKGGNVRPSRLRLDALARTTPEIEAPYARARLRAGDLVYSIRGTIGDCETVPSELDGCNITQDVARVAPATGLNASWLRFALLSDPVAEDLACGSLGAAVRGVNIYDLKRARIPVPPEAERNAIELWLTEQIQRLDELGKAAAQGIAYLNERRAALISAAVTGQIDVRQRQAEPA